MKGKELKARAEESSKSEKRQYLYPILLILCAGFIFYLSGIPHFSTGTQGFLIRKLGHSLVFGIFTLLLWKSIPWFRNNPSKKIVLCSLIVLAYAICDEVHQFLVPRRQGNYKGVLFDCLGGAIVLLWFWWRNTVSLSRR